MLCECNVLRDIGKIVGRHLPTDHEQSSVSGERTPHGVHPNPERRQHRMRHTLVPADVCSTGCDKSPPTTHGAARAQRHSTGGAGRCRGRDGDGFH